MATAATAVSAPGPNPDPNRPMSPQRARARQQRARDGGGSGRAGSSGRWPSCPSAPPPARVREDACPLTRCAACAEQGREKKATQQQPVSAPDCGVRRSRQRRSGGCAPSCRWRRGTRAGWTTVGPGRRMSRRSAGRCRRSPPATGWQLPRARPKSGRRRRGGRSRQARRMPS